MKPGSDFFVRQWVRLFWVDQMRRQNAPDLPKHISVEQFQRFSERLAAALAKKDPDQ